MIYGTKTIKPSKQSISETNQKIKKMNQEKPIESFDTSMVEDQNVLENTW